MKKEELEATIIRLEEAIEANNTDTKCFEADLKIAKNRLENINKPELTPLQFDKIQEAIEDGIGNFSFDDTDKFDKEFGIDYDGRVTLDHFDLNCSQELVEKIVEEVYKLFTEAVCPEEVSE
jgi:hypothetical protein